MPLNINCSVEHPGKTAAMNAKWYVAQLKPGRERVAIRGLMDQGFPTYYPVMHVSRARKGHWIDEPEPVFPCYLFLRSVPEPVCWRRIGNTRGIIRLLGNNQPCALPDHEIEQLQAKDSLGLLRQARGRGIRNGDHVEFRCGTFVGLSGICQWTRRERIGVLLNILGGVNVVVSPRDWLKLAVA